MIKMHRYKRAFRYVRNIAQQHCESYTQFCLRTDVLVEAINKAELYDEKEKPMKVIQEQQVFKQERCTYVHNKWYCPKCKFDLDEPYRAQFKYCYKCGQALDWSSITYGEIEEGDDS